MGMPIITSGEGTREQAITDLMESIALQETALSHILNAEGEKIQKAVCMEELKMHQLLDVNKSVERMVGAVTRLEVILEAKLELTQSMKPHKEKEHIL